MAATRLTKSKVDRLPNPAVGQKVYMDGQMPGFGICVGKRAKTYFAQRQLGRKSIRVTIGRHGIFTAEEARKEARDILAQMARGDDPNEAKRRARAEMITFREAFEEYLKARKGLRPFTIDTYRRVVDIYLKDWADKPLADITHDMIAQRHRRIGIENGEPTANNVMRVLRAIYNFAAVLHEDLPPNPVLRLTLTRAWYRERRRQTVIKPHELPAWYAAVMELESEIARDFLRLLLFTGMRRSEALRLRWRDVDLTSRTLLVPETKNHEPLMLPLSDFLVELLSARYAARGESEWVFPGDGASGHAVEPKKYIRRVRAASGVDFTLHDLRRTFITVAESLDISYYSLKRLLNHKDHRDVTAGYIVLSVERLRGPMQKITDYICEASKIGREGEVIPFGISSQDSRRVEGD